MPFKVGAKISAAVSKTYHQCQTTIQKQTGRLSRQLRPSSSKTSRPSSPQPRPKIKIGRSFKWLRRSRWKDVFQSSSSPKGFHPSSSRQAAIDISIHIEEAPSADPIQPNNITHTHDDYDNDSGIYISNSDDLNVPISNTTSLDPNNTLSQLPFHDTDELPDHRHALISDTINLNLNVPQLAINDTDACLSQLDLPLNSHYLHPAQSPSNSRNRPISPSFRLNYPSPYHFLSTEESGYKYRNSDSRSRRSSLPNIDVSTPRPHRHKYTALPPCEYDETTDSDDLSSHPPWTGTSVSEVSLATPATHLVSSPSVSCSTGCHDQQTSSPHQIGTSACSTPPHLSELPRPTLSAGSLPTEIVHKIMAYHIANLNLSIAEAYDTLQEISPAFCRVIKHSVNTLVLHSSTSSRGRSMIRKFVDFKETFDTVKYVSDGDPPGDDSGSIISDALRKCRRVFSIEIVPSTGLMAGSYPSINFQLDVPWFHLKEMYLDCGVSLHDAFDVLSNGRHTLQNVKLTLESSEMPFFAANSPVRLDSLHSLAVSSYSDLHSMFASLSLPSLRNIKFEAHSEAAVLSPESNVPWAVLESLSLESRARCSFPLGALLPRCPQLTSLVLMGREDNFLVGKEPLLPRTLSHLRDVLIRSERSGCEVLFSFLSEQTFTSLEISFPGNFQVKNNLTYLKLSEEVTLKEFSEKLHDVQGTIQYASFAIGTGEDQYNTTCACVCPRLRTLILHASVSLKGLGDILTRANKIISIDITVQQPNHVPDWKRIKDREIANAIKCTVNI